MEDASNVIAHEERQNKTLLGAEKKLSKMKDDEWNKIEVRTKAVIILCLLDDVLYNVMNEEITAEL